MKDDAPTVKECTCGIDDKAAPGQPSRVVYSIMEEMCPKHGTVPGRTRFSDAVARREQKDVQQSTGWIAPSACAVGICVQGEEHDAGCKGPGWAYDTRHILPGEILDLPAVSVNRGGLRFWAMLPSLEYSIKVMQEGRWWSGRRYFVYAFPPLAPGTSTNGIPLAVFKDKEDAEWLKRGILKYQEAVYTEIKRRVKAGAKW